MQSKTISIFIMVICVLGIGALLFYQHHDAGAMKTVRDVDLVDMTYLPGTISAEMCIKLPDKQQWLPVAELQFGDTKVLNNSMSLKDAKSPDVLERDTRCYVLGFDVDEINLSPPNPTLRLLRVEAEREGGLMTPEGVKATQAELAKTHPDLQFSVFSESHKSSPAGGGGGGGGIIIEKLPEGMSEEEAYRLIFDASMIKVPSNWSTTIIYGD